MVSTRTFGKFGIMRWAGDEIEKQINAKNLQRATEHLLRVANETVPLEEATLMRSGTATSDGKVGVVAYDTPYAVRQHEETSYRHDAGRRAKWLQLSLAEERETLISIIGKDVETSIGQGGI